MAELSLYFSCPVCGREYDAYRDCRLYDPPRRPMRDQLQATVICSCINPQTELRTQFEIVLKQKQASAAAGVLNRFLRRPHPSWEWVIEIERRDWP